MHTSWQTCLLCTTCACSAPRGCSTFTLRARTTGGMPHTQPHVYPGTCPHCGARSLRTATLQLHVCVVSSHTIAKKRCTRKPTAPRDLTERGKLNWAAHARGHALLHTRRCCSNIHCHITNYSASRRQRMVLTLRLRAASHTRAAARGGRRAPPLSTRACPQKSTTLILVANDLLSATSSSGRSLINRCHRGS